MEIAADLQVIESPETQTNEVIEVTETIVDYSEQLLTIETVIRGTNTLLLILIVLVLLVYIYKLFSSLLLTFIR